MGCKHLNQFSSSQFEWSISSCSANDRLYLPSIAELDSYCKDIEHKKCPVFLKGICSFNNAALAGTVQ